MYSREPLLASTSMAHIVGTVTNTIVNAPGAGTRIRLVAANGGPNRAATGVTDIRVRIAGGNTYIYWAGVATAAGGVIQPYNLPEPGISLPENTALSIDCSSTVATGTTFIQVYYFLDTVN